MRFSFERPAAGEEKKTADPADRSLSPNRRAFLAALGAALVMPADAFAQKGQKGKSEKGSENMAGLKEFPESFPYNPEEYDTSAIAGMTFPKGKLLHLYTGISGKVPPKAQIDFPYQAWKMWRLKMEKMPHDVALARRAGELLKEYKSAGTTERSRISLSQYITDMSRMVETTKKVIDWEEVKKIKELRYLSAEEIDLVRALSEKIVGKDLVAYSMTELLPSDNGAQNRHIMDFLLKNAGSAYLRLIPAQDKARSWSYYQLTEEYAVSENNHDTFKWGGASIINKAVDPRFRIPKDMLHMKEGVHHHRGAMLFAINSLFRLVGEVKKAKSEMRTAEILKALSSDTTLLLQYISTAHHQTGYAPKMFVGWLLDEHFRDKEGKSLSYEEYLGERGPALVAEGKKELADLRGKDARKRHGRNFERRAGEAQRKIKMGARVPALALYARKTRNNRTALDS